MAYTLVQYDENSVSNASTIAVTLPGTPTSGNLLVVTIAGRVTPGSLSLSTSGWTGPVTTGSTRNFGTGHRSQIMYWKVAGGSESATMTVTITQQAWTLMMSEYSGLTSPTLIAYTTISNYETLGTSMAIQTPRLTSGNALALINAQSRQVATITEVAFTNSYTEVTEVAAGVGATIGSNLAYKEISSTSESITSVTWTTSAQMQLTAYLFAESGTTVAEPYLLSAGEDAVAASESTASVTPAIPGQFVANDVAILVCNCNAACTFSVSAGWTEFTSTAINSANQSTAWYWRRLTGGDTAPTVTCSATLSSSLGLLAHIFTFRNCVASGDPFEDVTMNGSPTLSTTPGSAAIDTTGADRLAVSFVAIDDNNVWSSGYPPSGWFGWYQHQTGLGADLLVDAIAKYVPSAGSVSAVTIGTQGASDYWRTLTTAFIPVPPAGGGTNYTETGLAVNIVSTVTGDSQADFEEPVGLVTVTSTVTGTSQTDFKETAGLVAVVSTVTGTDQVDNRELALTTAVTATVTLVTEQYDNKELALAVSIIATVTSTDQADFKELVRAIDGVSTVTGTDNFGDAPINYDEKNRQFNIISTVTGADQADFEEALTLSVISTVTGTDNLSGAPIHHDETGRQIDVVSTVTSTDQADFKQLALTTTVVSTVTSTDLQTHRESLLVPIISTVTGLSQADFKDLDRVIDIISTVTGTDFSGGFDERGLSVSVTATVTGTDRAGFRDALTISAASTVSGTARADYEQMLAILILSTVSGTDLMRYANGVVLNTALALYLGATPVSRVYAGSTQVWP